MCTRTHTSPGPVACRALTGRRTLQVEATNPRDRTEEIKQRELNLLRKLEEAEARKKQQLKELQDSVKEHLARVTQVADASRKSQVKHNLSLQKLQDAVLRKHQQLSEVRERMRSHLQKVPTTPPRSAPRPPTPLTHKKSLRQI
jgi:hypothetical protein